MNKIISFSLFGTIPRYTSGAISNAILIKTIYPGWTMRVYHDNTVTKDILIKLKNLDVELIPKPTSISRTGAFWRFEVMFEKNIDIWAVRDIDSRLSYRERCAVDHWLKANKMWMTMHDHPHHHNPIIAGSFGGRVRIDKPTLFDDWPKQKYGSDEHFLASVIYPIMKTNGVIEYGKTIPFPTPLEDYRFVNERVDEFERPFKSDRDKLIQVKTK